MTSSSGSYDTSDIWQYQGQEQAQGHSGDWYEENQGETPRPPYPTKKSSRQFVFDSSTTDPDPDLHQGFGTSMDSGWIDEASREQIVQIDTKSRSGYPKKSEQSESSHYGHDIGKIYRPPKSNFESGGKASRSSRPDAKGKGRDLDILPSTNLTSKHGSGDASDSIYAFPPVDDVYASPSIANVADIDGRGKVEVLLSSFDPILDPLYRAPVPKEDQLFVPPKQAPYLQRQSRTKVVSEVMPYNEDFSQYVVQPSRNFKFGTVLKIRWSERMSNSSLSKYNKDPVGTSSISEFGKRDYNDTILYESIRRFIVVDGTANGARNGNSICVPIASYHKQGCTKRGVIPHQHGIIHTQDTRPMLLSGEPSLGYNPVRLVLDPGLQGTEKIAPESRINYSKHVTIDHSSTVHFIGKIHPDDLDILASGVDHAWEMRVRSRKKDKKSRWAGGEEQTSSRLKDDGSRSNETSLQLSERRAPDRIQQQGHQSHHSPAERSKSSRPTPFSPEHAPEKAAKDNDHSSLLQMVERKSAGIHRKPRTLVPRDSQITVPDKQDLPEELSSLKISSNVMLGQSSHVEGAEAHSTENIPSPNRPQSTGSSICLTETPPDTSATGPHLTISQRRQIIIQQLIAHVTALFQRRTQSRGANSGEHAESSNNQTRGNAISSEAEDQATQSNFSIGLTIPPDRKRKLSHNSNEEGSDEEERSPNPETKGKQKESQPRFACPYVKRYGKQARCNNNNKGWPNVARVKEHLYKHHRQAIHCMLCCITFKDQDALEAHMLGLDQRQCVPSNKETNKARLEGFSIKQEKTLKSRIGLSKLTEHEKWLKIFDILFPDYKGETPSPYFDPDDYDEPLAGLNKNRVNQMAQQLFYRVGKKLKASHGEDFGHDLDVEFFEEALVKAWTDCSSKAHNNHRDGDDNGIGAKDSAEQPSYQVSTSEAGPSCAAPDDDTNAVFDVFFDDNSWMEYLFEDSDISLWPNSGSNDKPKSDSGYDSK